MVRVANTTQYSCSGEVVVALVVEVQEIGLQKRPEMCAQPAKGHKGAEIDMA
jgi:hypothetical protein